MNKFFRVGAGAIMALMVQGVEARDLAITVTDASGKPVPLVMVTARAADPDIFKGMAVPEQSVFTDRQGQATVDAPDQGAAAIRLRKPGFQDVEAEAKLLTTSLNLAIKTEPDGNARAEARTANAWLAAMNFDDKDLKQHFRLQCGFCHQQGSANLRVDRTEEEWEKIIDRMIRYGSRLRSSAQKRLPGLLRAEHKRLVANPGVIPGVKAWEDHLTGAKVTEWTLGGGSSQLHDMLWTSSGKLYSGDNLQDNLIEVDLATNKTTVHKIPKEPGDKLGGNIGGRLQNYPGVGTYVGLHSLDESAVDGHLFLTGSDSSRLVEFAPETGAFTLYNLPDGFYPHTLRIDQKDRVWFTMAVSNQVAMFDRKAKSFKFYDLPARTMKEKATIFALPVILKLANWGVPIHRMPIDAQSGGLPLPYGIDIAPDGMIWFTRLHSDEIGRINPETEELTMFKTPFVSPRRLRTDADGNLWITVFAEGRLAKFNPRDESYTMYDLPTEPKGSETPYSLNVDHKRGVVWVTGTASDSLMSLDIASGKWRIYPLPRRGTFTRDVVVADDGSVYTSNGSFPAWHIEDGQPTAIRVVPGD